MTKNRKKASENMSHATQRPTAGPAEGAPATGEASESGMSAYEQVRESNMKRNAALLESLGIESIGPMCDPPVKARRVSSEPSRRRATVGKRAASVATGPQRRSNRLSGSEGSVPAKLEALENFIDSSDDETEWTTWEKSRVNALPSHRTHLDDGERAVYQALYDHRQEVADREGLDNYMVVQNRSLCEMIRMRPNNTAEMGSVWGMGDKRTDKYGEGLLAVLDVNRENLRTGARPVLDALEHDGGVVQTTASAVDAGGASRSGEGKGAGGGQAGRKKWKEAGLTWEDLDNVGLRPGKLVLRHNAAHVYVRDVKEGDSVSDALRALERAGKKSGNPKITGFIKVVDNARFDDVQLSAILENFVRSRRKG